VFLKANMIKELTIEEIAVCHGGIAVYRVGVEKVHPLAIVAGAIFFGGVMLPALTIGWCKLTGILNTQLGEKVTAYVIIPTVVFMFIKNRILPELFDREEGIVNPVVSKGRAN
jgi:hypothetical protein